MFVCVSLNPAIDKRLRLRRLRVGYVNRATEVRPAPGGKAAHVAMVLKTLGADPIWMGFSGGATGDEVVAGLQALSIKTQAVPAAGRTRTNLEIIDEDGTVTEILEQGEGIGAAELALFQAAFVRLLADSRESTTVILSGSLPVGVPSHFYKMLIENSHDLGARVFLDTSGDPFKHALAAKPEFVKPNREEAESWSGSKIDSPRSAGIVLESIMSSGAAAGAISLGAEGLVWLSLTEKAIFARVPELSVRSSVGSGDSTLAGFAFAAERGMLPPDAVRLAAACGSANCLAEAPGLARAEDIARLQEEILLEKFQ